MLQKFLAEDKCKSQSITMLELAEFLIMKSIIKFSQAWQLVYFYGYIHMLRNTKQPS